MPPHDRCRAERADVQLIVGHSHSFDAPILRAREIIASGALGAVRMINAQYYTDFLYRPRRPEELDTARGGGVVFSQAAHQVDIVRLLGGGRVHSVRAQTGAWDPARATEGAYAALLAFDDGAFASLTYSGYAHFDGDELCGGIGEMGAVEDGGRLRRRAPEPAPRGRLRRGNGAEECAQLRRRRLCRGRAAVPAPAPPWHQHFGLVARLLRARRPAADAGRRDDLRRRANSTSSRCPRRGCRAPR